jgi:hypothetical protein
MKSLPDYYKRARAEEAEVEPEQEPAADEEAALAAEFETNPRAKGWRAARLRRPD